MEANEMRLEAQDLNQQGAMLLRTGNTEAARAKFDKAIELDPMLMDSYKNYDNLFIHKLLPCCLVQIKNSFAIHTTAKEISSFSHDKAVGF